MLLGLLAVWTPACASTQTTTETVVASRDDSFLARAPAPNATEPPQSELELARGEPVPIEGSDRVRGRATVVVQAPLDKVRRSVLDFDHYHEFMPAYRQARVLGRTDDGGRKVYMQLSALHDTLRMWFHVAVSPATDVDGVETYSTKFLEGNVRTASAVWGMREIDAERTELSLEVQLVPRIPLPTGMLNEQTVRGAVRGLMAMKRRAEGLPPERR